MKRIKKWTPIIVEWTDAVTVYDPVHSDEDHEPVVRKSVGFLIAKNRKGVTIAMEDDRECHLPDTDCQTVTTIPAKMIRTVVTLVTRED